ncbi:hypothetical protein GCM10009733_006760 [Nonomuraea maheshkhaliensis]|uniref:XRE family transcriptional regulator n=1 Tax=Nonomuraea maheshkhaliensis TaxID=419590 RepID=A0ABP4QKW4_9ACTN
MSRIYDISDVGSNDQLIKYATAAQLERLREHTGVSHAAVAQAIDMRDTTLSHELGDQNPPSNDRLKQLDELLVALAPDMEDVGLLSSLGIRLRRLADRTSLGAHIPASWAGRTLREPPSTEIDVLIKATVLLSQFLAADNANRAVSPIRERHKDQIKQTVEQLIMIGVATPSPLNVDALVLLGSFANYVDFVRDSLERRLRTWPLGFRVWRAISKLARLSEMKGPLAPRPLKVWIRDLLEDAEELREKSLYPGRSLDLELALVVPSEWSPPEDDWVGNVLLARAQNPNATLRERATAAHGLWHRAVANDRPDLAKTKSDLEKLVSAFQDDSASEDIVNGLRWLAATLQNVIREGNPICNSWPPAGGNWLATVEDAAELLESPAIPKNVLPGTKTLFKHSLLQNGGVERRHAIETLLAAGMAKPVTEALGRVLKKERKEAWLRIRALFALGFLQHRSEGVRGTLADACQDAFKSIADSPTPTKIDEMHAALFAIGDCFGADGAQKDARDIREELSDLLRDLVIEKRTNDKPDLYPIARAASYMLTVTAQPRENGKIDLAEELLKGLREHPDDVTRELSEWALDSRFDPHDGTIRPLFRAA